jgi:hypothetical protein
MPLIKVIYSKSIGDVGMFSLIDPFLCGTVIHGIYGYPIGII